MGQISPLFARQPIFDIRLNVAAYELLFRGGITNEASFIDGNQASSHVLVYAFGQHRIEDILGHVPAYINFTRELLVHPPCLPPHKLVIEVLEDVKPDKHILESLKQLKKQGYQIALDDFVINENTKPLIKYATTIKIDVMELSKENINKYLEYLKPLKLTLLAEKIETQEMFEYCVKSGFDLFQGYFLQKPNIIEGVKLTESKQAILRLLMTLTSSEVEMSEIVNAIAADAKLSYKILKIVNSTAHKTPCEIHSLNQAVTLLGLTQIRNWATFLILSADETKPAELSIIGTTRAKLCELIGTKIRGRTFGETCFAAGLMSTFDAFLDIPLPELVSQLGLAAEIEAALLNKEGCLGQILEMTLAFEQADWGAIKKLKQGKLEGLSDDQLNEHYSDAIVWAQAVAAEFQ